ncbi:MAG: hypothetical protein M0P64_03080 [Candidatus Pacebacteria bacterium]|jgi:hypothetical protein|nr:hypothetical protein [Candidatus Paceibacterota bacterium]
MQKEQEEMTVERFLALIRKAARKDTSYDRAGWSKENPLWGHCAIVALLAQDHFGGVILRGSLENIPGLEAVRSHYWNKLPGGQHIDFTIEQFKEKLPKLKSTTRSRKKILSFPDVGKRYQRFVSRFNKLL